LWAGGARAAEVPNLEIELRLICALGAGGTATNGSGEALLMDLTRTGDRWERVWAIRSGGRQLKPLAGRVVEANVTRERVALKVTMDEGGVASVQVEVQRGADGRLTGTYSATTRPRKEGEPAANIAGIADGWVKPARPALPAGFAPAQPGEHPRILFRKSELPALREKLKTPLGQALFQRMGGTQEVDAVGAALQYQLTGETKYAELAQALTRRVMAGEGGGSMRTAYGRLPGKVALAYDLCYDVWTPEFRREIEAHLLDGIQKRFRMGGDINWHAASNWGEKMYAGAGFVGLALWGEKGADPDQFQRLYEWSRYAMYWTNREGAGTGGYRGESAHYGLSASHMSIEYAAYHRRMFGTDVSAWPDITHVVPRMIFANYYPEPATNAPVALHINGLSSINTEFFVSAYPIAPAAWQPVVLWAWNRHLGVTGPAELAAELQKPKGGKADLAGNPSWFFINYPLDVTPQPPAVRMPLTWEAPDFGYYGFRSGWAGRGEFVLQTLARSHPVGGWSGPNAGTFVLFGLGHQWNSSSTHREITPWEENRVILPDDKLNDYGLGRVTHHEALPDGSGSVSIDLDDVYCAPSRGLYSMYGNVRLPWERAASGVTGRRAIAVDYSGKSGAPCLFVLVDRIRGGQSKVWTWHLGENAPTTNATVVGNTFTIAKGQATLRGTFIAPGKAAIAALTKETTAPGNRETVTKKVPLIQATGGDDFFFVATVQDAKTAPPEIKTEGTGLDARVRVGARTIRFDGERIHIAGQP
jgi:hypothetical protein